MNIVFDTNIYIAAFLGRGFIYTLLYKVLDRNSGFTLYYSSDIKTELIEKFNEGKISSTDVDDLLDSLKENAVFVNAQEKVDVIKDDPDDNKILECALAAEADLVVTMDRHPLKFKSFGGIGIVHPNSFKYMFPKNETR
ncbi:MAG: putative toxin-antitoxin system toxin component, PIN family [Candidatus Doudnabacteria bacterium]|nr:putative toxin-antitoxin system toxin component, PIN family [Candidatus Doudnabacteria bacterium]